MKNIVVLVSGGGTNLQALIDAEHRGEIPNGKITDARLFKEIFGAAAVMGPDGLPTKIDFENEYTFSNRRTINKSKVKTKKKR